MHPYFSEKDIFLHSTEKFTISTRAFVSFSWKGMDFPWFLVGSAQRKGESAGTALPFLSGQAATTTRRIRILRQIWNTISLFKALFIILTYVMPSDI